MLQIQIGHCWKAFHQQKKANVKAADKSLAIHWLATITWNYWDINIDVNRWGTKIVNFLLVDLENWADSLMFTSMQFCGFMIVAIILNVFVNQFHAGFIG